ncbi:MAG: hypothetical protein QXD60_02320 [Nanopusillaceae archaeon]
MKGQRRPTAELRALLQASNYWGVPPEDLATLLMMESSMNPKKIGGLENRFHGLFQVSPENRQQMLPGLRRQLGLQPRPEILDLGFRDQIRLMVLWVEQQHQNLQRARRYYPQLARHRDRLDQQFSQWGKRIHWIYNTINPGAYYAKGDAFGTRGTDVFADNSPVRRWARAWMQRNGYTPGMERQAEYSPALLGLPTAFRSTRLYAHLPAIAHPVNREPVAQVKPAPQVPAKKPDPVNIPREPVAQVKPAPQAVLVKIKEILNHQEAINLSLE